MGKAYITNLSDNNFEFAKNRLWLCIQRKCSLISKRDFLDKPKDAVKSNMVWEELLLRLKDSSW